MPNHICNRVTFKGSEADIEKLLEFVKGTNFEKGQEGLGIFDFTKIIPETYKNEDEWYHWRIEHWGTKWNAYDQFTIDNGVVFLTAWSMPAPIFIELSKKFPKVKIKVSYADEDIGSNCGKRSYKNGVEKIDLDYEYSPNSCRFAKKLWRDCYGY